ncbi:MULTISPECIES: hypothetical protein [unclassified Bilifractor]|uniref:hypothetical protein n=1 Tax=unclassified Bilifractor TaxID=2815795 RepID=UPI003EFECD72
MNGRDASDYHKSLTGCVSDDERYPTVSAHPEGALFYANSEPQPNAKYSCAASVAIAR